MKKQFVVLGLGSFGYNVALNLIENEQQVVVIDINKAKINEIKDKVTMAVIMDCRDKNDLTKIIDETFDCAIICLGDHIESSILAAMHLKEIGIKTVIAKAISEDHIKILEKIGVDEIIFPEKDTAKRLAKSLSQPNILEYLKLSEGYSVIEIKAPEPFLHKSLSDLQLRIKYHVQVIGIRHGDTDIIDVVPEPNYKIKSEDNLIMSGKDSDLQKIHSLE